LTGINQGSKSRGSFSGARALDKKRSQRAWEFLKISQKTSGAAILKSPRKSWELPAFLGVFLTIENELKSDIFLYN
jgi:hypothetical protein